MKKTFNRILDRMTHLLNGLGSAYDNIHRDSEIHRTGTDSYEQAIRVEIEGRLVEIIVEATCLAEVTNTRTYQGDSIPAFDPLAFDWSIIFSVVLLNNKDALTLLLTKETTKHKLTKLLWKRDLEVFDDAFDAEFWIESNNPYAYGMLLDAALQQQLLANLDLFGTLEIQANKVYYKESLLKQKELKATRIKKHSESMLGICLTLAKKVDLWEPPLKV
jgi:hypothetical protein